MAKPKSVSALKKEADRVFSRFIRLRAADHTGQAVCVTCGVSKLWTDMQCGHYEKRSVNYLRYSEINCHVQCASCNVFRGGNYPRYAVYMVRTYGPGILEKLEQEAKITKQWKGCELEELIETYKDKLKQLDLA